MNANNQSVTTPVKIKTRFLYAYIGYAILGFLGGFSGYLLTGQNFDNECPALDERKCHRSAQCQAVYDQNKQFVQCITLSQDQQNVFTVQRELCEKTGGKWIKLDVGPYCDCQRIQKIFQTGQGCK